MMDHVRANDLMDLYGSLLTKRQLEILQLYFQEDFSLSEIQQELDISRAAVSDALKKATAAMEKYEEQLHLAQKNQMIQTLIEKYPQLEPELSGLLF